ncbi:MAG TPA: hypothetical protein VF593_10430 [Chthoniobacteraceae bacterium]|jgi:3D (Asp-Asp-Asp) domain-containing protein
MQLKSSCVFFLALSLVLAGCASRALPKYEKPLPRAAHQTVRTTAYTHTESDHTQYGARSASGGRLKSGWVNSAACDWSRWPIGTVFRIRETGELHEVDDYGWALTGTNTIDLYKTSRAAMNRWGVRRVNIDIERWGDVNRSLAILRPRSKHRHVRRMVEQIQSRYAALAAPMPVTASRTAAALAESAPLEIEPSSLVATASAPRAIPVARPVTRGPASVQRMAPSGTVQLTPFVAGDAR